MRHIRPQAVLRGIIFDFGSTLTIARAPWPNIVAASATALTAFLRDQGLILPVGFAEQWNTRLRATIQQADRSGIEQQVTRTLAQHLAEHTCPIPDDAVLAQALDRYFAAEDALRAPATSAQAVLAELAGAGYRLALLSNTIGGRWVQYWVDQFGFRPYLAAVVTSDALGYRKPRAEAFQATLARMGLTSPTAAVMVGDSLTQDIAGAQALGMRAVHVQLTEDRSFAGLDWPAPMPVAGIQPDACITALPALIPIVEGWQQDDG